MNKKQGFRAKQDRTLLNQLLTRDKKNDTHEEKLCYGVRHTSKSWMRRENRLAKVEIDLRIIT